MIQIDQRQVYTDLDNFQITRTVVNEISVNSHLFKEMFENYLQVEYGINEEKFKEIIKNLAPEEFI